MYHRCNAREPAAGRLHACSGTSEKYRMKKKRIIFPEKLKLWIDARSRYKLNHAQIEMARELGMDPNKFEGIAAYILEHGNKPLAAFIEDSYRERFGKNEPEDRRSIEQKLKAEDAHQQQKRTLKAQTKANAKWDALPQSVRDTILATVWCSQCMKTTTLAEPEYQLINDGLIVNGKCTACGGTVGRYLEGE
jgi:hypothetical protein